MYLSVLRSNVCPYARSFEKKIYAESIFFENEGKYED
jgi:hypothetical protein